MPVTLRVALATAVLSALVLGAFPGLDREVTRLFFDAGRHIFPIAHTKWGQDLRELGMYLPHLGWITACAAIVLALLRPSKPMRMRPSVAIFLIVTALAIPALLVNGGFKQHWGRPRPVHVTEFGGKQEFRPWWDDSGTCARNCSFMSGETSAAAMLVGAAALAPLAIRPFAIGLAGLFTLMIGLLRVAFGGHWLSDVLLGGSVSVLLVLAARQIILVSRGIEDEEARLALSQTGFLLRSWWLGYLQGLAARLGRLAARAARSGAAAWRGLVPVGGALRSFARAMHASARELRDALVPAGRTDATPAE